MEKYNDLKRKTILFAMLCFATMVMAQNEGQNMGWPEEGFFTPYNPYCMVPVGVPVTFKAPPVSAGCQWSLPGATPENVNGQSATVTYSDVGDYDLKLDYLTGGLPKSATLSQCIHAGGEHFIWNISPAEESEMNVIAFARYGWYAGTNTLGIVKFAEFFHTMEATEGTTMWVDSVGVRFGAWKVGTHDAVLRLSITRVDDNGFPSEEIASTTLPVTALKKSATEPTFFRFENPVNIEGAFFVVMDGFPNGSGDGIAIQCVRRNVGEKCTAFHLIENEDAHYQPTGTYTWYQNLEDPTTLAIHPWMRYELPTDISNQQRETSKVIRYSNDQLYLTEGIKNLQIFTLNGTLLFSRNHPATCVSLDALPKGIYIVRADQQTLKIVR